MNQRFRTVFMSEYKSYWRRPLTWVLIILLGLMSMGLASGNVAIQSGDSTVGGESRAWLTSEFWVAMIFPVVVFLAYVFFVAVGAGMTVMRDDDLKVDALLHSTKLTPREYIWAKFWAVFATFVVLLGIHLLLQMFFNHLWPNDNADKIRGPFALVNYLRPATLLALPTIVFFCGVCFAIGERFRTPILVFVTPVVFLFAGLFFFWDFSPSWLDPRINRLLMWLDPAGFRWIDETWLKLDRGVEFYNTQPVVYDVPFLLSRLAYVLIGFGSVAFAKRHFEATLRGADARDVFSWIGNVASKPFGFIRKRRASTVEVEVDASPGAALDQAPLAAMGMASKAPGFVRTVIDVARFESAGLRRQAGLYIFVPLIVIQAIGNFFSNIGAMDTPILLTSGTAAVQSMGTLTLLVALLLLFYTVESVVRERNARLDGIFYATPAGTGAMLLGKAIANGIVGVVVLMAMYIAAAIVMLFQGKVTPELGPFLLTWGLLLVPTFLVWSTFVTATFAITGNRYATYAVGLAALIFTGWKLTQGEINWVGNWALWGAVDWTDFGSFDPNQKALFLNRLFYLAVMAFLIVLTVKVFPRREFDSGRVLDRLKPMGLVKSGMVPVLSAVPAIILGSILFVQVGQGFQGQAAENRDHDYWSRNINTWNDVRALEIGAADIDVTLDPQQAWFRTEGSYALTNTTDEPMPRFPMSIGDHFGEVAWTLDGEEFEPDNRARLCVFELETPLAPGDTTVVGFAFEGRFPKGLTKNGGGIGEFILPVGVVLTSFSTGFVPVPYFEEGRGVDSDKNETEPKDWDEDFYVGRTPPGLGSGARFPVRTTIRGPAEYQYHGVGVLESEEVSGDMRTTVWNTDHPVNFFNVVAGKWEVWEGEGASVYYLPKHTYNIDEIGEAIVAARRHFSEWFHPYPWQELKLNEFAGLATYAQGFPTNITFSEAIGFLTRSTEEAKAAFMITAHETAHQWWGNILMPGEGPGGNILSEGMAHYSTVLLAREVKGERAAQGFLKQMEESYGESRQVDSEKPLVWVDGTKAGDTTVQYDKGGWVFLMLQDLMGDEAMYAGLQSFVDHYSVSDDYPVLFDFVDYMRDFAPDTLTYDTFVEQWFMEVVAPEFKLADVERSDVSDGSVMVTATIENVGTGRMPVEVVLTQGDRYEEPAEEDASGDGGAESGVASVENPDWRVATTTVTLGPGEIAEVQLDAQGADDIDLQDADLELIIDPDVRVLMLQRDRAVASL